MDPMVSNYIYICHPSNGMSTNVSTDLGRDFYLHRELGHSDPVLWAKNGFIFPSFGGVAPGMSILGADSYSTKIGALLVFNFN